MFSYCNYVFYRIYKEKVIKFAQQNGYVETLTGRRRYLEHINNPETSVKRKFRTVLKYLHIIIYIISTLP